jgi:hypothetical protein
MNFESLNFESLETQMDRVVEKYRVRGHTYCLQQLDKIQDILSQIESVDIPDVHETDAMEPVDLPYSGNLIQIPHPSQLPLVSDPLQSPDWVALMQRMIDWNNTWMTTLVRRYEQLRNTHSVTNPDGSGSVAVVMNVDVMSHENQAYAYFEAQPWTVQRYAICIHEVASARV